MLLLFCRIKLDVPDQTVHILPSVGNVSTADANFVTTRVAEFLRLLSPYRGMTFNYIALLDNGSQITNFEDYGVWAALQAGAMAHSGHPYTGPVNILTRLTVIQTALEHFEAHGRYAEATRD